MTTTNQLSLQSFIARYFTFENPDKPGSKLVMANPLKSGDQTRPYFGMCCSMTRKNMVELNRSGIVQNKGVDKHGKPKTYEWQIEYNKAAAYELLYRETDDQIICLDIDGHHSSGDIKTVQEFLSLETTPEIFKTFPYTVSRTKNLPHFFVKLKGIDTNTLNNIYKDCFGLWHGDLLISHSWEKADRILYNFHDDLPAVQWEDLKKYFDETKRAGADLLNCGKPKTTKQVEKENTREKTTSSAIVPNSATQKYKELFDVIQLQAKPEGGQDLTTYRSMWLRLCDCMKSCGLPESYWFEFCKKNSLSWDPEKEGLFHRLGGQTDIFYVMNVAKTTNKEAYLKWQLKWNTNIPVNVVNKGERDVAEFISSRLFPVLRFTKLGVWWQFNQKSKMWDSKKHPTAIVVGLIHEAIDETIKITSWLIIQTERNAEPDKYDELMLRMKILNKGYQRFACGSVSNQVNKYLEEYLYDEKFEDRLDKNVGFLAFQNGMLNLKTKEFRSGLLYEDFLTCTIPHDYKEADTSYIKSVLKKILNNNDEHLDYFLTLIGYSFTGDSGIEKDMYFMIDKTASGGGDNGKTFFFYILSKIMPNYVYQSKASLLEEKNTKKHKQLILTKGKRLVWLDELPKESQMDFEIMKQIADGTEIENEIMFGTSEKIGITYKMFGLSNHIPKITPDQAAVFNRYKQVSFNSHFDRTGKRTEEKPELLQFVAIKNLRETIISDHYDEVISLVIEYANRYYKSNMPPIPKQFEKDTQETKNSSDEFGQWFMENIDTFPSCRLAEKILISKCGMPPKDIREGMKRQGYVYNKELKGMGKDSNDAYYKGGYIGVALKDIKDDDEDGEDFDPVQSFTVI